MPDAGDILNDDDFLVDVVDTSKECTEQHKKRKCLKSAMDRGKAHSLVHKWTHEKVDKASDEIINKTYSKYKQREITGKGEETAKALRKHAIKLYSKGISRFVKIRAAKKYAKTLRMVHFLKIRWLT